MSGMYSQFCCRRTESIDPCPSGMSRTILKIGSERGGGQYMHRVGRHREVAEGVSYIWRLQVFCPPNPLSKSVKLKLGVVLNPLNLEWTSHMEAPRFDWGLWFGCVGYARSELDGSGWCRIGYARQKVKIRLQRLEIQDQILNVVNRRIPKGTLHHSK